MFIYIYIYLFTKGAKKCIYILRDVIYVSQQEMTITSILNQCWIDIEITKSTSNWHRCSCHFLLRLFLKLNWITVPNNF